ncbi:MAG: hypothetical protein QNJ45_03365 [Ardenticatenaceae bacterium]|nr:hypothetical protein [Ardenticatenaceae bacterium]
MSHQLRIAHLNEQSAAKIQDLEKTTGKHIMAFEEGLRFATLSDEEVNKIQVLEKELGVILIVYDE